MQDINKILFIFVLLFLTISSKLDKMKDIEDLTLEEKLGQLLVIGFQEPILTDEIRALIRQYKFGNFIFFTINIVDLTKLEI